MKICSFYISKLSFTKINFLLLLEMFKEGGLSLVASHLTIEYAMQYTYSSTSLIHIPILKPIGDENS